MLISVRYYLRHLSLDLWFFYLTSWLYWWTLRSQGAKQTWATLKELWGGNPRSNSAAAIESWHQSFESYANCDDRFRNSSHHHRHHHRHHHILTWLDMTSMTLQVLGRCSAFGSAKSERPKGAEIRRCSEMCYRYLQIWMEDSPPKMKMKDGGRCREATRTEISEISEMSEKKAQKTLWIPSETGADRP